MKSDEAIVRELEQAAEGLLVMSESDYPLELIRWSGDTSITPEYLCSVSDRPPHTGIEETDLAGFFRSRETFRPVVKAIENNLSQVRVYRVGLINIPVYIVGRSPEGNWLGLSTRVIET